MTDRERILTMPQAEAIERFGYEAVVAALIEQRATRHLRACAKAARKGNCHPDVVA